MLAHRVIPTILCRGRQQVKGVGFDSWRSVGLAAQAVRVHQERGVDEIILLDVTATKEGRGPDLELVRELSKCCFMPLTVGGGVRTIQDVDDLLRAGADKVAICTAFEIISDCAARFGSQAIVASMDVKGEYVYCHSGEHRIVGKEGYCFRHGWPFNLWLAGAGEILLNNIEHDGTMAGYDLGLIGEVASKVDIPVIASGGCSGYEDMLKAIKAGASAVAAGALFQFTDATPMGAATYLHDHGIEVRLAA